MTLFVLFYFKSIFIFKGGLLKAIASNIKNKIQRKTPNNLFVYSIVRYLQLINPIIPEDPVPGTNLVFKIPITNSHKSLSLKFFLGY